MRGIRWLQNLSMLFTAVVVSVIGFSYASYRQIFKMSGVLK